MRISSQCIGGFSTMLVMLQKKIVIFFFAVIYNIVVCESKCSEYIVIMKETICPTTVTKQLITLNDTDWQSLSCPNDKTYKDIYENKDCVLDLSCSEFTNSSDCPFAYIPPTTELTTTLEPTTTTKTTTTTDPTTTLEPTKTLCMRGDSKTCVTETINAINVIYINENTTSGGHEPIHDKWDDLNHIMQCTYSAKCVNIAQLIEDGLPDHNVSLTISVKKKVYTDTEVKYNSSFNVKGSDFICSNLFKGAEAIHNQYKRLSYDIIRNYSCGHNITNNINSTTDTTKQKVNIYFHKKYIFNATNADNIKCMDHFGSINNHTRSLDCHEITPSIKNDNLIIWDCEFSTPMLNDTSKTQSSSKIINFQNCKADYRNKDKNMEEQNNILLILKKDITLKSNDSVDGHNKKTVNILKFIHKNNLNLVLIPHNGSDCDHTNWNITNGNIINALEEDEEQSLLRDYDTKLVNLKVLNCITNNSKETYSDKLNESLDLNIIFNKPNNTDLKTSVISDLYKVKTNSTKIIVLDCVYPVTVSSTDSTELTLVCTLTDLDTIENIIKEETLPQSTTTDNPKSTTVTQGTTVLVTTKSNTISPLGFKDETTTDKGSSLDPIVYIFIALVSTCIISAVIAVALKKCKAPVSYHLTSTREWPAMEGS